MFVVKFDELKKYIDEYSENINSIMEELSDFGDFKLDHVCILAKSTEDYNQLVNESSEYLDKIKELPHSGRHITVGRLKKPLIVNDKLKFEILELSEPKPKREVEVTGFDHISFLVHEFSKFADLLSEKKYSVYDYKTIAGTKLFKLKYGNLKLEFRDRSIVDAEEGSDDNTKLNEDTRGSENDDLQKEREAKLRAIADYQNLKKQVEEEKKHILTIANASLLSRILDVLDDFDRAKETKEIEEGMNMIYEKLKGIINEYGVVDIEVKENQKFDPTLHEVIGTVNVENEDEVNVIKQVVQKGYKYSHNDQVVRPVRVIVGKAP